jgi:hypothetical protein
MRLNLTVIQNKFLFSNISCTTTREVSLTSRSYEKDLKVLVDCDVSMSPQHIMTAKKANAILGHISRKTVLQTRGE